MTTIEMLVLALCIFVLGFVANDLVDVPTQAVVAAGLGLVIGLMVFKQRRPRK